MDKLLGAGKEFLESRKGGGGGGGSGSDDEGPSVQGGAHLNRPAGPGRDDDGPDLHAAARHASSDSNESSDLFGTALSFIKNQNHHEPIDEEHATRSHDEAYSKGKAGGMDASSMGAAAAMQALKRFQGGGGKGSESGGGDMQSKLIGMAMSEATKLFESSGGSSSGSKQDAVSSAGSTMMKLVMQSKMKEMMGGSDKGGGGGMGQLMGLASKLM